jgi:hypothetical protein
MLNERIDDVIDAAFEVDEECLILIPGQRFFHVIFEIDDVVLKRCLFVFVDEIKVAVFSQCFDELHEVRTGDGFVDLCHLSIQADFLLAEFFLVELHKGVVGLLGLAEGVKAVMRMYHLHHYSVVILF